LSEYRKIYQGKYNLYIKEIKAKMEAYIMYDSFLMAKSQTYLDPKYIFFERVKEVKCSKPKIVWNLSTGWQCLAMG